ncbi:MAG: peptide deformylase [Minisyncoccota bacterium]
MIEIIQKEHPALRAHAGAVALQSIGSTEVIRTIQHMKEALAEQDDGVAIAAPQIGVALRIFIISKRALEIEREGIHDSHFPHDAEHAHDDRDMVFINPEITKVSKQRHWTPEGCLSVRWLYGKVLRAEKATVRAYDERGKRFTRHGSGLMAQIFQHETDHLNGVLFTDKARAIEEIPPENDSRSPS